MNPLAPSVTYRSHYFRAYEKVDSKYFWETFVETLFGVSGRQRVKGLHTSVHGENE